MGVRATAHPHVHTSTRIRGTILCFGTKQQPALCNDCTPYKSPVIAVAHIPERLYHVDNATNIYRGAAKVRSFFALMLTHRNKSYNVSEASPPRTPDKTLKLKLGLEGDLRVSQTMAAKSQ